MVDLHKTQVGIALFGLAVLLQAQAYDYDYGEQFRTTAVVFNAFPDPNVTAFVLFEEDRISRLSYGGFATVKTLLERHSDFIIQFKTVPKEVVVGEYTDFGFMEEELDQGMEVVLILQRNTQDPGGGKPQHRVLTSASYEPDYSKLYLYNAVWNSDKPDSELNFYGLYLRQNYDGSESESLSQLAVDIAMNEGKEIELQPGTQMEIKAFYFTIGTVSDFKHMDSVVHLRGYKALAGRQRIVLAYGDYQGSSTPAEVRLLDTRGSSARGLCGICTAALWGWTVATTLLTTVIAT